MQKNNRSYKDLKQNQKSAIADKTYGMYLAFYLENHRMPDVSEMNDICKRLFATVQALALKQNTKSFIKLLKTCLRI